MIHEHEMQGLKLRRLGIDTYQESVIFMRRDCAVCRAEGFEAQSRIAVHLDGHSLIATLNIIDSDLLEAGEAGLSESAWQRLGAKEGDIVTLSHLLPLESLRHLRAKVYGHALTQEAVTSIIRDVAQGRYSDIELAAFITACAGRRLDMDETIALTRAMIEVGDRLTWPHAPIVDKHCIGGLPGNRTTMIVVPIVAAFGLTIPKTSSRAITSPAGTADVMETITNVHLDVPAMKRVVDQEGGCVVWGGAIRLSPADDMLIRVERPLDLDSEGQLIASVLSKKAAAGSTHVVIDIPVGVTAKVRSAEAAHLLSERMTEVGRAIGLTVRTVITDGAQPVGRGIGPALEARDVLSVLRGDPHAPQDLRERALMLAGMVIEFSDKVSAGEGYSHARQALEDGRAWQKFLAICQAQGGFREPAMAAYTKTLRAEQRGHVTAVDNRRLARIAKLAGAPSALAAGLDLHVCLGQVVEQDEPLFTIHSESPGELAYAAEYVAAQVGIIKLEGHE
jgi:thymidine phosphorylase